MKTFSYERAALPLKQGVQAASARGTKFLAGGTNLVDLMKYRVESPTTLVDINHLDLAEVTRTADGGVTIGAMVRNSDLANHPLIKNELSAAFASAAEWRFAAVAQYGNNRWEPAAADSLLLLHRCQLPGLQQAHARLWMRGDQGL